MDIVDDVVRAKQASLLLAATDTEVKDRALRAMADALDRNRGTILKENQEDVSAAEKEGLSGPMLKRLVVTDDKITGMIDGINDVISLTDPVGETMSTMELDDGLILYQMRCPIGLLGVIFESRPDVVPQIMSLCLKSGNAVVFKGGREAFRSNRILFDILSEAAYSAGIPKGCFALMEKREDVDSILSMDAYIDLLIPRGSNQFVRHIQSNTKIPVLGHAAGICHIYLDSDADLGKGIGVMVDSKVQYPAVCNAAETFLINESIAPKALPLLEKELVAKGVEIRCDERSIKMMPHAVPAKDEDWDTEYGDLIVSVRIVKDVDEAIAFINTHSSHHTDCIISENKGNILRFVRGVDSADVFVNASTRFADGYRFGKGAEVGISTNKIHTRGPVGMEGLMIYKYVLIGNGQMVKDYVGPDARKFTHKTIRKEFGL